MRIRQRSRSRVPESPGRGSPTGRNISGFLPLIYLLIFSFHPLGLAVLIGLGTFLLMAVGRDELVVTAGVATVVVMVVAARQPTRRVTGPNALSIPPHITGQQVKGFALAGGKIVLDGGVGKMIELARANVRNIPHPTISG